MSGWSACGRTSRPRMRTALDAHNGSRRPRPSTHVIVEQDGPVRAVVRLDGKHGDWLPFTVRLYFYAGATDVRIVHSFVWDGDPERDFLAGLGSQRRRADARRAARPARPAGRRRYGGFLTEAVRGLTGLRRDPGERGTPRAGGRAHSAGRGDPEPTRCRERLHLIPQWNDYTLDQTSADGFTLRKRTGPGHAWVTIPAGDPVARATATSAGSAAASASACATSGSCTRPGSTSAAPPPTRRPRPCGCGRRGARRWTCASSTTAWARTATPNSSKASRSPTRTTSPASATPHGIARTHELTLRAYDAHAVGRRARRARRGC